jgi:arsenite-transporting ATPase
VLRTAGRAPDEVRRLLPRLRDPEFTKVLLVTLAEATPVHEAAQLQRDLERAEIRPFAWIINRSLVPLHVTDPVLRSLRTSEFRFHEEVRAVAARVALIPWTTPAESDVHLDRAHRVYDKDGDAGTVGTAPFT